MNPGPLRHIVAFRFQENCPEEFRRQCVERFCALRDKIPEIQALEWGKNASPEHLHHDMELIFLLTFVEAPTRDHYLTHPAHQQFVRWLE